MAEAGRALVLVTGFGPYPKVRVNPTAELARQVAGSRRFARLGLTIQHHVFETAYGPAGEAIRPLLAELAPVACLHLGLAPREKRLRLEARGENRTRALYPDARGNRPGFRPLRAGAPAAMGSTAALAPLMVLLRRTGFPVRLSRDAGAYLCNAVYFWSLDEARLASADRPVVFLHIPWPAQPAGRVPKARQSRVARPDAREMARIVEELALRLGAQGARRRPCP